MPEIATVTTPDVSPNVEQVAGTQTPRVAVFTHDTFGLGHLRRCRHIVRELADRMPDSALMFISGSPALHVFGDLPRNADFLKVPTIAKTGSKLHQPPHLPIALAGIRHLRQRLIQEAALGFAPDVFLVDNFPLGSQGELLPTLHELRRLPTQTVLGLRDILDAPDVVRRDWTRQGMYDVLDRYYDRILIYGMREVLDVEEAYGLPPSVAAKVTYCGYVTDPAPTISRDVSAQALGVSGPFILAAGGGGGDGFPLLRVFLAALEHLPDQQAVVITGPLMSRSDRDRLRAMANARGGVILHDYVPDLGRHVAAADLVVGMCGYNSAAEIVSTGARALLVPRTWRYGEHRIGPAAGEEFEQLMRARALTGLGLIDMVEPAELTPDRLADRMLTALTRPGVELGGTLSFSGLTRTADEIVSLL
jgi:predicted glycosyltransferase